MEIKVVSVAVETKPTSQGRSYKQAQVVYYTGSGKGPFTKNLVSFKNPDVFKVLTAAKAEDVFEVDTVKNDKYTDWVRVVSEENQKSELAMNSSGEATKAPVKIVERVTELDRNRYIVRQSSLERAIETLCGGGVFTKEEVTELAGYYETWVFRPVGVQLDAVPSKVESRLISAAEIVPQTPARPVTRKPGRPKKVVDETTNAAEPEVV